jgi:predicted NAD-dependent protein-ADP-ribosyltransferase YbiA (DUF1768 family)
VAKERYKVMEIATWDKFLRNKSLKDKLLATQQREIVNLLPTQFLKSDDNLFFGVFQDSKNKRVGKNMLGTILS